MWPCDGPCCVTWIGAIICGCHISLAPVTLQTLRLEEFHTLPLLSAKAAFPHCRPGRCCGWCSFYVKSDSSLVYCIFSSTGLRSRWELRLFRSASGTSGSGKRYICTFVLKHFFVCLVAATPGGRSFTGSKKSQCDEKVEKQKPLQVRIICSGLFHIVSLILISKEWCHGNWKDIFVMNVIIKCFFKSGLFTLSIRLANNLLHLFFNKSNILKTFIL